MAGAAGAAMVSAAAVQAERRVISHFMSRNAVSPQSAVPFDADRRIEQRFFERLRDAGVIAPASNGGYYLDVPRYDAWQANNRTRAKWIVLVVLIALVIGVLAGFFGPHR